MTKDKKKVKTWKKVVGVLLLIPIVIAAVLGILYLYADNKADIHTRYNEQIETGGSLEAKYLKFGSFETKKVTEKAEAPIKKYTVYYP